MDPGRKLPSDQEVEGRDRWRPDWASPRVFEPELQPPPASLVHVRFRRISPVAAHCGDRLLSEPTAGTQPWRREPLLMPQRRHSLLWPTIGKLSCYRVANRWAAARKSAVSKPSTNCPNIGCRTARARSRCPWTAHIAAKSIAVRNSHDRAPWRRLQSSD